MDVALVLIVPWLRPNTFAQRPAPRDDRPL
jgi:hypothetical protein